MTKWVQKRTPNLNIRVKAGWCLGYVSQVLGIDSTAYSRATYAWNATKFKHGVNEPLPNVPVLLWFDHYGHYNEGPGWYGHVVYHVPGVGFYTSPWQSDSAPASFEVWQTIAQIEARFNCTYVGWSEDLAGIRFAEPRQITPAGQKEDDDMAKNVCVATAHEDTFRVRIFVLEEGEQHQFTSSSEAYIANVAKTYGCELVSYITNSHYSKIGDELADRQARLAAA